MPAAVALLVGGLLATFAGHRLFKLVLAVYGFLIGALAASSVMSPADTTTILVAAGVGGLAGALILIAAYFIGVALVGAGLAALLAHVVWSQFGRDPHPVALIVISIAGALGALSLQRWVIVIGTALGGAWTTLVGAVSVTGGVPARPAGEPIDVWILYPSNPAPGQAWVIPAWLLLAAVGLYVQLRLPGKRK
jgi:hypothetical protein